MKKLTSFLILAVMLLTVASTLVSCAHKCEFSDTWSKDANSHWHVCNGEDCTEVADKADHTWDEGKITTAATQEAAGVKTYTCSVCQYTKTEPVEFTGMTEAEWEAATDEDMFKNFTYTEVAKVFGSGVTVDTSMCAKFTENAVLMTMTAAGQSSDQYVSGEDAVNTREQMFASMEPFFNFDDYEYDKATKTYKLTGEVNITSLNTTASVVTIKFEGGKLAEIKYSCEYTQLNVDFSMESTITFTDYGTTVATAPAQ